MGPERVNVLGKGHFVRVAAFLAGHAGLFLFFGGFFPGFLRRGLLFPVLLVACRGIFHGVLELPDAAAHAAHQFGYFLAAEEDDDDQQDDQYFRQARFCPETAGE